MTDEQPALDGIEVETVTPPPAEAEESETSDRFDPLPDRPYGFCNTCRGLHQERSFATKDDAQAHLAETREAEQAHGRSHSITVTNPERSRLIEGEVDSIIQSAITDAIEELVRLTEPRISSWRSSASAELQRTPPDATVDEIQEALRWYDDFQEAWKDYLVEVAQDEEAEKDWPE